MIAEIQEWNHGSLDYHGIDWCKEIEWVERYLGGIIKRTL